jgi:hypothetical protein
MKVWLYFQNILARFAKEDNPMEIVDVTFSRFQDKEILIVLKMQEI